MNALELLRSLHEEGIQLWCEGEKLRYRAPKGRLAPGVIDALTACKPEIIELLQKPRANSSCFQPCTSPQRSEAESYPVSFAQQRMCFLQQLEPDSCALNVAMAFSLSGSLNVQALGRSLDELIGRHEALRTTCEVSDGASVQTIAPYGAGLDTILRVTDLRSVQASDRPAELRRLVCEEARKPFDLSRLPMVRASLFRIADHDYVFLLTTHHAVIDGWSVGIVFRELSALYRAHATGVPSGLGKPAGRYCDYAAWQRQRLQGPLVEELLAYWKRQLDGVAALDLPKDRLPPASPSGQTLRFVLPSHLSAALRELARCEGVTLYTLLLAAFQVLLHRYSRQDDIVVGTAVSDRCRQETQSIVGCFANALAIRTRFNGNLTFRELLVRVRDTAVAAFEHQDMPFELLVERTQPDRLQLRNPIFQVAFLLHQQPADHGLELAGVAIRPFPVDLETARFDILLEMQDQRDRLSGSFEYSKDLFAAGTIRRMAGHFQTLLESITANPGEAISKLPLLGAPERQSLFEWSGADATFPADKAIHELFEAQAERIPERPAVIFGNQCLSYRELNARSNRMARQLRDIGVRPGTIAAICAERSAGMIVGVLAILKAGGAYLPLDPDYPADRLEFMMADSQAGVLVTQRQLLGYLPNHRAQLAFLDESSDPPNPIDSNNLMDGAGADDLAYIIYTSGSTGRPKGVMIAHQGLCNLAVAQSQAFGICEQSRVLQFSSLSFDASVSEIFTALSAGAALCLGSREELLPGPNLTRFLQTRRIDIATIPPSLLRVLPDAELPDLKTLISAGEACSPELVRHWSAGRRFLNAYGPTEATVCATLGECSDGRETPDIGRPLSNVKVYILDEHLKPTPVGVPGELCVGGVGLARGYLNRPDLTAERFIQDPFSTRPGGRLYRTGDLARFRPDGRIEYLGRADDQVKVRGYRIELGEIESALREQPDIGQAAVTVQENENGEKCLIAYLAPRASSQPGKRALELWPSTAEFFVYDDLLYHAMTHDERRNESYRRALAALARDKVVLDIGTGPEALLARLALENGARRAYAVELLESTFQLARQTVEQLGLGDRIKVIHGDIRSVNLPERAEVCVSEIVGPIGGVEGAALLINEARRLMVEDGVVIPGRSRTKIAALTLPDFFVNQPSFTELTAHYVRTIFAQVGYPFDLRLCLKHLAPEHVVSTTDLFEDLDFQEPVPLEGSHEIELRITRDCRIDGFVVWLTLETMPGDVIDILAHEHCWLPVFLPVFHPRLVVSEADIIRATVIRTLCDNGINPDYRITGSIFRQNGEEIPFDYASYHDRKFFRRRPFYERLFPAGEMRVTSPPKPQPLSARSVRENLVRALPDYMIPSAFVILDKLPLTPNGKLDRRALPAPERQREEYRAPRTPAEEILCGLLAEMLKLERVGIEDNFFALGGDSILSILLVSRARRVGLELTPRDVFQQQTVGALAAAAKIPEFTDRSKWDAAAAIGEVIPTPIMRWLQERGGLIERFNQSMLLQVPRDLTEPDLAAALQALIDGHDMLRLRLERNEGGDWGLRIAPRGAVPGNACLTRVDLAGLKEEARQERMQAAVREAEDRLNLEAGRILQAVWFVGAEAGRLSLVIHHLAVDGVSWRILVPDLATAWSAVVRGETPELEPVGTPFRAWAQHLAEEARTPALLAELPVWEAILEGGAPLVPGAVLDPVRDRLSSAGHLRIDLPARLTSALLTAVPAAFHAQINDVLLGALAVAVAGWRHARGYGADGPVLVDLEGHGREPMDGGIDLSRTVGWFTSLFPVGLDAGPIDIDEALAGGPAMGRAFKRIKEQLRAIPSQGVGYGLLRYLHPETRTRLAGRSEPQIGFNYLGRFVVDEFKDWSLAAEAATLGGGADLAMPLAHLIDVNALTVDGPKGPCLSAIWSWASALLAESEVRSLAEGWQRALEGLVHHVEEPGAGGHTSSDFPLVALSTEQVEELEAAYPALEDILPLSPLQEGLLFHAVYDRSASDVYNVQIEMEFEGSLDARRMQRAVKALVRRHANLRAAFRHEGLERPVQVIVGDADVPWREEDLSALDGERQEARRKELLAADLAERFVPSAGPLLRSTLLRLGRQRHLLVFTNHHLLLDGWSTTVFFRELLTLYRSDGDEAVLPRVHPYAEYLAWLAKQNSEAALATWRDYLSDLEGPTRLAPPMGRDTSPVVPECWQCALPVELSDRLQRLARERGLTLNTIMQGLWAVLLGRLTGRDDVVFGITVSGRPAELTGVEQMLGLFINTLPLRVRLPPGEPLAVTLAGIQESQARLLAYQHVGLAEIKRQAGGGELFDTLAVFENYPLDNAALTDLVDGLQVASIQIRDATHYPLCLVAVPGEQLHLRLDYDPARFERATAEAIGARFVRLLEEAVATPGVPLHRLEILSSQERDRVLKEFNDTARPLPEATLPQLFEAQVEQTPEATALIFGEESLSYQELNTRANQVAAYLRNRGVGVGTCVGLCMERSAEMLSAMLGILKAGGAYVPLDPSYPKERLNFMINDAQVPVVLCLEGFDQGLADSQAQVIYVDRDWPLIQSPGAENPASETGADSLAYVIYTSGSTGTPKGVAVPHRAVMRLVINTNYVELGSQDRIAHVSNVCFDAATFEIWGALLTGGSVVVIAKSLALEPRQFALELERQKVSTLFLTTALFNELACEDGKIFQGLKQVLFGGEAVNPRWVRHVLKSGAPKRLLHVYGPTECTTFALFYLIEEIPQKNAPTIPIGKPISNTTAYVLDRHGNPVPVGIPGELYLGGEGLAHGYINQPELTRDKFVPNPFADTGHLLYRTGDIVRYLPDGNIEFIGRADGQVKIRGFRIEPGEVEVVLKRHPAVEDAVVTAREDEPGERRLAAYIVPQNGDPTGDWRSFLQEKLPDYMIPSAFVILDKLPLTPNGKVDRHALPAPERQSESYRPPRTPQEEILCGIFAEVLKLERVGIEDNFFALGGHSLLAIQLVNRMRETLGVELDVRTIFEMPVVSELASGLGKSAMAQSPIVRHQRPQRLPLSNAQERLWFLDRLEGSSSEYNMAEAVRLRGKLNLPALDRAINTLLERHESLRTRFGETDGEPFQIIEPACHIPLEMEDLSVLENGMRETAITAALCRESEKHFDLSSGPLFRIKLLRLGECDHILLWTCHHIINDGWSITIFNREIALLYEAFCEDRQNPLSPLPLQYADYALWQRNQLRNEESQALLTYWRKQLADAPTLELPTDRPRPSRQTKNGAHCSVFLPQDLTSGLKVLSREENCTLFMSFLAAFKLLLSRHSGQEDISLGIPAVNRSRVEIEGLIGCFLNTLVLRTNLSGNITFRELMRRVRKVTLGAYANSDLPFEKLVEELQPERTLSYSPLFQVFLNFISIEDEAFNLPGLETEQVEQERIKAKFDLTLYAREREEGLFLVLVYNTDLFEAATAERMLSRFQVLLDAIVANPDQYIGALPLLTPDDQKTYTVSDNRVRPTNPYVHFPLVAIEQSIGTRFEEQVREHSTRTAVKTLTHEWTYAELDRRANVIAREILRVCPDKEYRVALLLEHDAPMVAAILGALKAGKTYVPLSPSHPRMRLANLLSDSQARALVTDSSNGILARELAAGGTALINLNDLAEDADGAPLETAVSPNSLAYLLYTSGSTGEPKGVAQDHRNVLHHIRSYTNSLHIGPDDRLLMLASYGFDAAVMDIFAALLNGAALYPYDARTNELDALAKWIHEEEITIYHSTPTLYRYFANVLPEALTFPKLRLVVMGGEKVVPPDLKLCKKHFGPPCIFVNGFGPSESTVTLQCLLDRHSAITAGSIPIGYPVEDTEVLLLNAEGDSGQVLGEIAIRSPYLAQGYWRRPELTAAAFLPDPQIPGRTIYRTGDVGRLLPNGMIEFLCRRDSQVKIRGYRVEPAEIEFVLSKHPEIADAAVVSRQNARGEQDLIAYVVSRPDRSISSRQLRDFASQILPNYMIPSAILILERMPLTASGKIDRKALPAHEDVLSDRTQAYVAPGNSVEKTMADIWIELLKLEKVGVHDDFFESGGHSLLATRLVSQIRRGFNVEIPLRVVFESPTIAAMSDFVQNITWAARAVESDLLTGEREEMVL